MALSDYEIRQLCEKHGCSRSNLEYILELEKQKTSKKPNLKEEEVKIEKKKTKK